MRENASLHLPPEAGVDVVISGELSSAAGESFSFVEATEGAELAAEQAHVRSEETVLLSLLEPGTQGLEVTGRRLVISRHARDLGQSNLPDPAAVELSQALVRLPGERDGFVETVEHRQEPGPREQRERPGRRGQQLVELRQRLGRRSRAETEGKLDPEETHPLLAGESGVLQRLPARPGRLRPLLAGVSDSNCENLPHIDECGVVRLPLEQRQRLEQEDLEL